MLGWSINLFRIFGIRLAVHVTFFLLLAFVAWQGWQDGGWAGLVWQVILVSAFFVCVVLHELGHSLTARRYGVNVPRILLMPIGGMAEFDHVPRRPSAEFLITIAGPAVNFAIAALLLPFVWRYVLGADDVAEYSTAETFTVLFEWNLVMGFFNLLPIYPMDGGRILRSILALWLPYLNATWWAVTVTRFLAPVFSFIAFYYLGWKMLGILFIFIFFAGNAEYRVLRRREQEAAYWAEAARRIVTAAPPPATEPPLLDHGAN